MGNKTLKKIIILDERKVGQGNTYGVLFEN